MEIIGNSVVGAAVETLIDRTQKGLFIVTPYFKPWDRVARGIKVARSRNAEVLILLRGGEDYSKSAAAAADFIPHGVKFGFLSRLHAKVYLNETEAILTSMNLYADSAQNSYEVAVRYTKAEDEEAYKQVAEQLKDLFRRASEEAKVAAVERAANVVPKATPVASIAAVHAARSAVVAPKSPALGHCIRCDKALPFNPEKPLCPDCYKSWAKFASPDYEEQHCHRCGKVAKTSAAKPLCRPCWSATA